MKTRVGVLIFALVLVSSQALGAPGKERKSKTTTRLKLPLILSACQKEEQWRIQPLVPKELQENFESPPGSRDEAFSAIRAAYQMSAKTRDLGKRKISTYVMARSFYEMGLIHIAYSLFESVISDVAVPSVEMEAVTASLVCINEIHKTYPTLRGKTTLTPTLRKLQSRKLSPNQKMQIWKIIAAIAGRKISDHVKTHSVDQEIAGLNRSGAYELLIRALDAYRKNKHKNAMKYSLRFLRYTKLPPELEAQRNPILLNLARVYYNERDYRRAVYYFDKVEKSSNLKPQALMGTAWAKFMMKDYEGSAGSAVSLVYQGLRSVYAPHAPILLAIIQYENCRYADAYEAMKTFKKRYGPVYKKLYGWHQSKQSTPDFYKVVTDFFEKEQKGLPRPLVSEWVRSPAFLGLQQEMNLILEEEELMNKILKDIGDGKEYEYSKDLIKYVKETFQAFDRGGRKLEELIIRGIRNEILWANYFMIGPLVDAFDNGQLIEAEILRELGTTRLIKNREEMIKEAQKKEKESKGSSVPSLDWGSVDTSEDASEEVWEDEVGAIKAEFTSQCIGK